MNYTGYSAAQTVKNFMYKVYGWMAAGLALTAGTAYYVFSNPALFQYVIQNPVIAITLLIVQLGLVIALAGFVSRMSVSTAITVFLGYSFLTGITLSSIFAIYNITTIYLAFAIAAGMFLTMAVYGYFSKDDLSSVGAIAQMGLFGIIIALIVNAFMRSGQFDYIISLIGVGVFTLLTAYDTQKIKQIGNMMLGQGDMEHRAALVGALTLYLDFINLFLFLLRLFGRSRDE